MSSFVFLIGLAVSTFGSSKYLEDFEFIERTVASSGASVSSKKIAWRKICHEHRSKFARCQSDVEHVKNVMELLATLQDSHTGVTQHSVDGRELPGKFDGLYGAGLWLGWEDGRLMVRGIMPGHPQEKMIPMGSAIVGIGDEPAWWSLEREARRIKKIIGVSTEHSLWSSLANRCLPFGDDRQIALEILTPELELEKVTVPRWGPGGKAFYPTMATLPEGIEYAEGATAGRLEILWSDSVGYLRITGSMNEATAQSFHAALDSLKGIEALLLDCRWMGGGSDHAAWDMAGRFFKGGVGNGRHGRVEASGSWQFDGPVVMLQNASEVSSAETFTWAMSETERVISVGRATGGWGIIPKGFQCPSGLVSFRLGVNDRPTPIEGVHTEGVGWPADVTISFGVVMCQADDPTFDVGLEILGVLHSGEAERTVRDAYAGLFAGQIESFKKTASGWEIDGVSPERRAKQVSLDLEATLKLEITMLTEDGMMPDMIGSARRFEILESRGKAAGFGSLVDRWRKELKKRSKESKAQSEALNRADTQLVLSPKDRKAFLKKHGKTRIGEWISKSEFK